MASTAADTRVEEIAQDLFQVITQLCLAAPRSRRRTDDLKEIEFLTLALLHDRGTMIVGDIQRLLGILPAQMSRVIRSLENRPCALITCRINPSDKRKIDVCLTENGAKALLDYQAVRVHRIAELLQGLPESDQVDLLGLLEKVQALLELGGARDHAAV
jgi:DNA-binding MarR family transcriptional regulator